MAAIRTQVYLDAEHYQRLQQRRRRLGLSMAEQVREAVRLYLDMVGDGYLDDPVWRIPGGVDYEARGRAAGRD